MKKNKHKLVSIVIPTRNSAKILENCLKSIKKQAYPNVEIIIADGKSSDNVREIAKKYDCRFFLYNPKIREIFFDAPHKINYGASKAKGYFMYWLDADMELTKNLIRDAVSACEKGAGAVIIPEDSFGVGIWAAAKQLERRCYWGDDTVESPRFFKKKVWNDVGGLENIKEELKEAVEWPLKYSEVFKKANTNPPKGILLYGAPGTGKPLLAKAVANESGVNFISVKGPSLISKYVGESERAIREVFKIAKQASPTILFFDEIDSIVPRRGSSSTDAHVTERVISQFLTEMDGIEELKGVVVLASTNRLDLIDPALLRSGRFDILLELPLPDEKTREEIFRIHTKNKPIAKDVDLKELAKETEGNVGSDIEFICKKASMLTIREFINRSTENPPLPPFSKGGMGGFEFKISKKHFEEAIKLLKTQNNKNQKEV